MGPIVIPQKIVLMLPLSLELKIKRKKFTCEKCTLCTN
jgi:hypothetical protein